MSDSQLLSELQGPASWNINQYQSVVKLTFEKDGTQAVGTGFVLFLPLEATRGDLVILTAAHNLAATNHARTKNLRVYFITGNEVKVSESQTYFCKDYTLASGPAANYGFIRVPRPNNPSLAQNLGFGFSLQFTDLPAASVQRLHVTGYFPEGSLHDTIGSLLGFRENEVEYDLETRQGQGGSPVWLVYEQAPIVVAIHNNGKSRDQPESGSRGAPISIKLIQVLYEWLRSPEALFVKNKQLQAFGTPRKPPPTSGLFLSFSDPTGSVGLGAGSLFDRVLVQSIPNDKTYGTTYALRLSSNSKWVRYDTQEEQVVLDAKLGRYCFSFWDEKKNGSIIQIGTSVKSLSDWRTLQLRGDDQETFKVSLTPDQDKQPVGTFCFRL